jgi:hypothetical protein
MNPHNHVYSVDDPERRCLNCEDLDRQAARRAAEEPTMKKATEVWEIIKGNHFDMSEALDKLAREWPATHLPDRKKLMAIHSIAADAHQHLSNLLLNTAGLIGHYAGAEEGRLKQKGPKTFEEQLFELLRSKNVTLSIKHEDGSAFSEELLITGLKVVDKGM